MIIRKNLLTSPNIIGIDNEEKMKLTKNRISIFVGRFLQGIIQLVIPKVNHRMKRHCNFFRTYGEYRGGGRRKKQGGGMK